MFNIEERIRTQQNLTLHEIEAWYQSKNLKAQSFFWTHLKLCLFGVERCGIWSG